VLLAQSLGQGRGQVGLLGILLGFGKENAQLFNRKVEITRFLFPRSSHREDNCFPLFFKPIPSSGFTSLEEELAAIEAKEGSIIEPESYPKQRWGLHFPLSFLVDITKTDLVQLRAQFKREQKIATHAYRKGKFLEITLQKFLQSRSH
jgi:hypothetical protein